MLHDLNFSLIFTPFSSLNPGILLSYVGYFFPSLSTYCFIKKLYWGIINITAIIYSMHFEFWHIYTHRHTHTHPWNHHHNQDNQYLHSLRFSWVCLYSSIPLLPCLDNHRSLIVDCYVFSRNLYKSNHTAYTHFCLVFQFKVRQ